jgi:hypothetical protein
MPQLSKVSQRRFLWDQFIHSDSGACRPRIPNRGDHQLRCPGKTGRHAIGTSGRYGPEQVDGIRRNRWSAWPGLCTGVLGGGGNVALHGQVVEKGLEFRGAQLGRVAAVVEVNVSVEPVGMGFLGADGAVFVLSSDSTGCGWLLR